MALTTIGRKGYDAYPIASIWRVNTNSTGNQTPLGANWEQVDAPAGTIGVLGAVMTQSSGVFTFPVTGYWLVQAITTFYMGNAEAYAYHYIQVTDDNSTWRDASVAFESANATDYCGSYSSVTIDVTDTTNIKVRLSVAHQDQDNTNSTYTHDTRTGLLFLRLGET